MQSKWRVLPRVLFLVVLSALVMSPGTTGAATGSEASRGSKKDSANDGTYDVTVAASTCSDGLSKTTAASRKLTVEGKKVSIANADGNAAAKTGEVSNDGSFTISSTLPDGSTSTASGTLEDGHVQGTFSTRFVSGITCTPSFSGQRVGAPTEDPVDELIDEFGLEEVFEEYDDFCDGRGVDCPTIEKAAGASADAFEDLYCPPEGCDQEGFSRYQRALPDLILKARLLAADGRRFPGVKATLPIIVRMAFHGVTDGDPASARQAASAAWRLFATVAKIDYVSVEL